jgi:hypothetical protein|tara:strand:+ start:738 stop:971 length:234 start_codon:yes stop_codon:yes gene_type:complete
MYTKFRREVRKRVEKLLLEARESLVAGESMDQTCDKIVSMICDPLGTWYYEGRTVNKEAKKHSDKSFSEAKERWIAR